MVTIPNNDDEADTIIKEYKKKRNRERMAKMHSKAV